MIGFPASAITTWGAAVVFINVLLTRLGLPIPAVPILLFAGSAIAAGTLSFWHILAAAVVAAMIGDAAWFTAGRIYGRRLIGALSRLSPAIDSRVDKARAMFERFGVPLVSISKFVPGLALITPPLMGTTAVDTRIYAVWDFAGATAWATFWLLGGAAAERQLHMLLEFVRARGGTVIDILVGIALIYLVYRLDQRRRERKRTASIDAEPLIAALPGTSGRLLAQPKVLDARPQAASRDASDTLNIADRPQPIPGALALDPHSPDQVDCALRAYDMVIYCICPDSATAVEITQRMRLNGYTRIRALRGGLDAWQKRGFPVEPECDAAGEPVRGKRPRDKRNAASGAITLRGLAPRRVEGT